MPSSQLLSQLGGDGLPVLPNAGYELGRGGGTTVIPGAPRDQLEHRRQEIESLLRQRVRRAAPGPTSPDEARSLQLFEPVRSRGIATAPALRRWVGIAVTYAESLPAKR